MECRDLITGVEYTYGCQQQLAWYMEDTKNIYYVVKSTMYIIDYVVKSIKKHYLLGSNIYSKNIFFVVKSIEIKSDKNIFWHWIHNMFSGGWSLGLPRWPPSPSSSA
jgi:hypothetical protein